MFIEWLLSGHWPSWAQIRPALCQSKGLPLWHSGKESTCHARATGDAGRSDWEDPLEETVATRSGSFAWGIHRTEKAGGLQSAGSQNSWTWLTQPSMHVSLKVWKNHQDLRLKFSFHLKEIWKIEWTKMEQFCTFRWNSYPVVSYSPHCFLLLTQVINHPKKRETYISSTEQGVPEADVGYKGENMCS